MGLSTQPCGVPVLRVIVEDRYGPSLTACGHSFRKFRIQSHISELRPSWWSLVVGLVGMTVLKAEL